MKLFVSIVSAAVLLMVAMTPAHAHEKGDKIFRAGVGVVAPDNPVFSDSDDDIAIDVDDGTSLTLTGLYMLSDNWGFEILASWPFSHDVSLGTVSPGSADVKFAETKHLPPTFSMQYHFLPSGKLQPYAGLGLNYTTFFDTNVDENIVGSSVDLDLDDSFGFAAQLGADVILNDKWMLNFDFRYINIETDATLTDGSDVTTTKLEINPWVYSVNIGFKF